MEWMSERKRWLMSLLVRSSSNIVWSNSPFYDSNIFLMDMVLLYEMNSEPSDSSSFDFYFKFSRLSMLMASTAKMAKSTNKINFWTILLLYYFIL
jgi:hypothetical protein